MFRVRGSKATLALYGGVSTASMGLAHTHTAMQGYGVLALLSGWYN